MQTEETPKPDETMKISAMLYFKLIVSNQFGEELIHFIVCNSFRDIFARNIDYHALIKEKTFQTNETND